MRHADYEGREHERRYDHFNEAEEDVGEQRDVIGDGLCRFRIGPQDVAGVTDENTQHHTDENNCGKLRTHGSPPTLFEIGSLAETVITAKRRTPCAAAAKVDRPGRSLLRGPGMRVSVSS